MTILRNSGKFCKCVYNNYVSIKRGKVGLRKDSKHPYESALRQCTSQLKAKGRVHCSKIIKEGRKLTRSLQFRRFY